MNYNDFLKLLHKDNIESSYLLIGEEDYLINECIKKVKGKYIEESFETINYSNIDGKSTFEDLLNTCETLPFVSPKRIVVLKEINSFIEREEKNVDMYKYLDNLGVHVCLLLVDSTGELKKTTKLYKYYKKHNRTVEFDKLKGKELNLWIENVLSSYNKNMSYSNINYLIQQSSYLSRNINLTLYDLENEIKKIINYSSGNEITKDEIDLVMAKSLDNNIFDLLASINKGDIDSSLSIFNVIYMSNEPIQKILFMISRQIRLMLGYSLYKKKGYSEGDIQSKLQIKPYEFGKISSQARMYTINSLEKYFNNILDVDKKLKTSIVDQKLEMEILIVNLANMKK